MDKFKGKGGRRLAGSVAVTASKNSTLPIICASLLASAGKTVLSGIPDLVDIRTAVKVCNHLGAAASYDPGSLTLTIDASNVNLHEVPYDLMRRMRASFLFILRSPLILFFMTISLRRFPCRALIRIVDGKKEREKPRKILCTPMINGL